MEKAVSFILFLAGLYLLLGLLFALAFLTKGITKVDEDVQGTGLGFRLLILPGLVLLWPALLMKWIKQK